MFKLTRDGERVQGVILKLEGRLAAAWVDEFARVIDREMSEGEPVTLNLDGLSFADERGVAAIRSAIERGARLAGGSNFIGALIGEERPQ